MTSPTDILREAARHAQETIIQHPINGRRWVDACPGAGKTNALILRHRAVPMPTRQGRAMVSFTRKAAKELTERTRALGLPVLVEHPHFFGTLDTFLWTFLVRADDQRWSRLDDWSDHPDAIAGGFPLDDYDITLDTQGQIVGVELALSRLPRQKRNQVKNNLANLRKRERTAQWKLQTLLRQGFLTGRELRWQALRNLYGPRGDDLIGAIKERFGELIIDEAQDCSQHDLQILDLLTSTGLPLLMVGDLDQGIHGYRDADPQRLQQHVRGWRRYELTHNWRSTPAICAAAATLRSSGKIPDIPVGPHCQEPTPILLIPHDGQLSDPVDQFVEHAADLSIAVQDCLVLAHSSHDLPREFVGSATKPERQLAGTAWAIAVLRTPHATDKQRRVATRHLKNLVLKYWTADPTATSLASQRAAIADHRLNSLAHALVSRLPELDMPAPQWCEEFLNVLETNPPAPGLQPSKRLKLFCPPASRVVTARQLAQAPSIQRPDGTLPTFSVIHQAKGTESEAVMVIIPDTAHTATTVHAWITDTPQPTPSVAEDLRVLYVAATRARRLLAFAVPEQSLDDIAACLEKAGVPIRVQPRTGALF